jgi:hypothetical protein
MVGQAGFERNAQFAVLAGEPGAVGHLHDGRCQGRCRFFHYECANENETPFS